MNRPHPDLLVHWGSPWNGFVESFSVAFKRSEPRLELECRAGLRFNRYMAESFLLHLAVLLFLLASPRALRPTVQASTIDVYDPSYHIVYYPNDELPLMTDAGGALAGRMGKSGGRELYYPTQVIHIARGVRIVNAVADAPRLNLPSSNAAVANILAPGSGTADPGPPPTSLVRSALSKLGILPAPAAVAPAPQIARQQLQKLPTIGVIAVEPAPSMTRLARARNVQIGIPEAAPPAVTLAAANMGYTPRLSLPAPAAVAPPPEVRRVLNSMANVGWGVGEKNVVPPPVIVTDGGPIQVVNIGSIGDIAAPAARPGNGSGIGGAAGSAPGALSSVAGMTGGSGTGPGAVVVSGTPGSSVGMPGNGSTGSLAMGPGGGREPGYGGSGGGTGIGVGKGPGAGSHGNGPGAANAGEGLGAGASRFGTSLGPGPGGSGSGDGTPGHIPGVTIKGNHVSLPSFGTNDPAGAPGHGPSQNRKRPPVTVVATSRSGGALASYGAMKGAKVYTIYLDTTIGTAVMQYAERASSNTNFQQDLEAPEVLNDALPKDLKRGRLLFSCILDSTGALKNIRIVDSSDPAVAQRTMAALRTWRFRPVLRGEHAVDVDVMLGFSIDTN